MKLTIIYGNEPLLVNRAIEEIIKKSSKVLMIQDLQMLKDEIYGFPETKTLVCRDFNISSVWSDIPDDIHLVSVLDDKPKEEIPEQAKLLEFKKPTTRKEQKAQASKFLISEARSLGRPLETNDLAEYAISMCGVDLGILRFEIFKAFEYAKSQDLQYITKDVLTKTIRYSAPIDMGALIEAFAKRDKIQILRQLKRIEKSATSDVSMLLLRAKGGPADVALTWLHIASLFGKQESEIADRVGIPLWALQSRDLPAAKAWGLPRLRELIRGFADIEKSIVEGRSVNTQQAIESLMISTLKSI